MTNKEFPWGTVTQRHQIGEHCIVEYVVGPDWSDAGKTNFHVEAANQSFDTLEQAMLGCACHKLAPGDTHLINYVIRLIGEEA